MTPNERLAMRHLIKLCLSTTTTEEVIHRERLRQAEAAIEADRAAEQQKVDDAKAYVQAFDARSRKLAEQAVENAYRAELQRVAATQNGAVSSQQALELRAMVEGRIGIQSGGLARSVGGN